MGRFNWIALVCVCACALASPAVGETAAAEPIRVAVYAFELEDFSAGGGIIPPDARDNAYLDQATEEARRLLAQSGRYALVDTAAAQDEPVKARTLRSCRGCIGPITRRLGAEQAVIGTIKRINRTEYTLLIQFFDAKSGEPVANFFTGLRMGANYAWPRGVTWLMKNRILSEGAMNESTRGAASRSP
jgi:hypothetical protein